MGDTWINVRIGVFHLQCKRGSIRAWTLSRNSYWKRRWIKKPIAFYEFEWRGWEENS